MTPEQRIMSLLNNYSKTSIGKNKIKGAFKRDGSSDINPVAIMEDLKEILYSAIITARPALKRGFSKNDIIATQNIEGNIEIYFDRTATRRESLFKDWQEDSRTGDGVDNIIALFSKGYNAKRYAYGIWGGHYNNSDTGLSSLKYGGSGRVKTHTNKNTGKPGLAPDDFLNEAINSFNMKYLNKGIRAYLSGEYLNGTF